MTGSQSENYSHRSQCMGQFFFFFCPLKAGIFILAVGVGHVVKAAVIGSACPVFCSHSVCHAASAANETATADTNICFFSTLVRWEEATLDFQESEAQWNQKYPQVLQVQLEDFREVMNWKNANYPERVIHIYILCIVSRMEMNNCRNCQTLYWPRAAETVRVDAVLQSTKSMSKNTICDMLFAH